jgi:hypothetical protein
VRFDVLKAVVEKVTAFWNEKPYSLADMSMCRDFREAY